MGAAEPGRILPRRKTDDGWSILTVHWSCVPGYQYEAACAGLTEGGIRQELEIDWSSTSGKRVFPQFGVKHHVATEPLKLDLRRPIYCGWDFGTPAFVMTQLNLYGQWLIFPSLSPPEEVTIGIYEFGQMVAELLFREYAEPAGLELDDLKLIHFGDPAGKARPPRTGDSPEELQSCFEILDRGLKLTVGHEEGRPVQIHKPGWGWKLRAGAVNLTDRLEGVRARLTLNLANGHPALVVDPRAQTVIEGFTGGYHYKQRVDGRYELDPNKNFYSHTLDALGYIATRLFVRPKEEQEDADNLPRRQQFRSHAAGRVER